jgi:hypothetical protein
LYSPNVPVFTEPAYVSPYSPQNFYGQPNLYAPNPYGPVLSPFPHSPYTQGLYSPSHYAPPLYPTLYDEQNDEEAPVNTRRMNSNVQSGIQQFGEGNMNLQGNIQQVGRRASQLQTANSQIQGRQ